MTFAKILADFSNQHAETRQHAPKYTRNVSGGSGGNGVIWKY